MKNVTIIKNQVGLVIENDAVVRILTEGKYWIGFGKSVNKYDMAMTYAVPYNLDVLLQNDDFRPLVTVLDIADNELVIVMVNNHFNTVLKAGRYIYWNGATKYNFRRVNIENVKIGADIEPWLYEKMSAYIRISKIESYEKGLLYIDGKMEQILEPGNYYFWKNNKSVEVYKADMRQTTIEITGQEILTKDKAQLRINFSAQYQITDIMKALYENKEFDKQLYIIMQLALRGFIGRLALDELMENKARIGEFVINETRAACENLGVNLTSCGVKDIILPGEIRDIMNQVLIAEKKAQANIIMRREETASTRSLLNTAKLMEENTMLYKLKEMEYVEKIADKINTISLSGGGQIVDQLKELFIK